MLIQCLDDSHVRLGFRARCRRPLVPLRGLRRQADLGVRDRRLRHALLEHDHRPDVWRAGRRPDVPEVSHRLRPLPLRTHGQIIHARGAGQTRRQRGIASACTCSTPIHQRSQNAMSDLLITTRTEGAIRLGSDDRSAGEAQRRSRPGCSSSWPRPCARRRRSPRFGP